MPGKPLLSLTTRDIAGATPTPLERYTNKPPKDEVPGSKPKLNILTWNRPVMNLTTKDIPGNEPVKSHFRAHATRITDPMMPTYALPAFRSSVTPEPKFLRNTLDWTDVQGTQPKVFYSKNARDPISVADIEGTAAGTTPRSKSKHAYSKRRPATSLDVHDITSGKHVSTRHTNPLDPEYIMRCESSLGYMGRGAMEYAKKTAAANEIQRRPSLQATNMERPTTEAGGSSATEKLLRSIQGDGGGSAIVTVGPVERSKPGWRPDYSNKYYENGVRMKDASLRSDDCEGTKQLPNDSFYTISGGIWRKSERLRRGFRNQIPVHDVEGASPHLKKDTMHRSLGRQSDQVDPVYIPLEGVQKAGLLEREISSKPINVRKALMMSSAFEPDQNAARQLAQGNRLSESVLNATFKSADLRKTGTVSYPTFVQGLNSLGVAMPAKDAIQIARQLDPNGTGEVDYSVLPAHLNGAYAKRVKLENEETARRIAAVEEQPQMRVSSLPPMMKLKDKLYQKNEKLYKSFGMFDLNKVGSVTTAEFAKTVEDLNIGVSKQTAMELAKEVDFAKNGIITYYEFANKMDFKDDFARPEDRLPPPKTPPEYKALNDKEKSTSNQQPSKTAAAPGKGGNNFEPGDTALSIDLGTTFAGEAPPGMHRQQSRAGSKAGSGRATPSMRFDSRAMLEQERAVEQRRAELDNVAALPDGTPRGVRA